LAGSLANYGRRSKTLGQELNNSDRFVTLQGTKAAQVSRRPIGGRSLFGLLAHYSRNSCFLFGTLVRVAGCFLPSEGKRYMPSRNKTDMHRTKALACDQRASDSSDPTSKQDWEELAIEWHTMANFAARGSGEITLFEVV
jgi:hypothetical protein